MRRELLCLSWFDEGRKQHGRGTQNKQLMETAAERWLDVAHDLSGEMRMYAYSTWTDYS